MTTSATDLPLKQHAVQLVGPGELRINPAKEVFRPGPHQVLAKIECVGLCFSDLKLLKQFDQHARKGEVVRGLGPDVLKEIPSYVPGSKPTVPGHEVTCRIVAVGEKVKHHRVGERCLVQTDYRNLPTAASNSAFGYNFEGALQEYVLMDERVIIDTDGERFLIPVPEDLSASSIALVEPWACVEDSYVTEERQHVLAGGRMLVVAEPDRAEQGIDALTRGHAPREILRLRPDQLDHVPAESIDDCIYFGCNKSTIDRLNDSLATRGIMNVVLGGGRVGQPVSLGVGRVHYGLTRWIGTTGNDPADSYRRIPRTGELRENDTVLVVGAGGPMGQMHVIRTVCSGIKGLRVVGTDMDDARLASILSKAEPLARAAGIPLEMVNTAKTRLSGKFSYIALMAPVGKLVADAVQDSAPGAIINIFAGIPAAVKQDIDLDTYIANGCYMFGTSGSTIRDMKIVLQKVVSRSLDTNTSVDAVSGMKGAPDGIAAVENRTLAGKIIVYPQLHELPLTPLVELPSKFPTVAAKLDHGRWTHEAEQELLRVAR